MLVRLRGFTVSDGAFICFGWLSDGKGTMPTAAQLRMIAIHNALPFVGFGFLDNFIMIVAVST